MVSKSNNLEIKSQKYMIAELDKVAIKAVKTGRTPIARLERLTITIESRGTKPINGHFDSQGYVDKDGIAFPHIMISAEALLRPMVEIGATLVHEMVHLSNHSQDIQDTSKSGRHNKKFEAASVQAGLEIIPTQNAQGREMYDHTKASPELAAWLTEVMNPDVFTMWQREHEPKAKAPSKVRPWTCDCEPKISINRPISVEKWNSTCHDCDTMYKLRN